MQIGVEDFAPQLAEPNDAQIHDHLSAFQRPLHAGLFEALCEQRLARRFGDAAADRQAVAAIRPIVQQALAFL